MTNEAAIRTKVLAEKQSLFDALLEEHLAVQQIMVEAMNSGGEPSEAAYARLGAAFAAAAEQIKAHSVEASSS